VLVGTLEEGAKSWRSKGCTMRLINTPSVFSPVKLEERHKNGLVWRNPGCYE